MVALNETNPLPEGYHDRFTRQISRVVYWTAPGLQIIRLRLLTDPGFPVWDVSYCHGIIGDEVVRVQLPFGQLPKFRIKRAIVEYAKTDNLFAKRTGIFDCISTLC